LVPMVSGRGLGHTGGTLDKLEAIPGFRTQLDIGAMRAQLDRIGVIMVGQGKSLAPADGKLYALRDVTSTVEFEPFIVSSIVSKKLAEGAEAIVYDVKCGNGAFMKDRERAAHLARRLVATTRSLGKRAQALVTDMSQPLGVAAGNALEVQESVQVLRGGGPADVRELTLELAAMMLTLSGAESDAAAARARATRALDSGAAWSRGGEGSGRELHDRCPGTARARARARARFVRIRGCVLVPEVRGFELRGTLAPHPAALALIQASSAVLAPLASDGRCTRSP